MISILLVDDEEKWMKSLRRTLNQNGITTSENIYTAETKQEALAILASNKIDMIFLDLNMGQESGEDVLKIIKDTYPEKTTVIMTGLTTAQPAVNCMKLGADDYFTKTMRVDELIASIKRMIKIRKLEIENNAIRNEYLYSDKLNDAFKNFITVSPKMYSIFKYLQAVAASRQPILITGESGVGKGVLAKAIATLSHPDRPFISVNLAGLDDQMFTDTLFGHVKGAYTNALNSRMGMVQQAKNGTVFLDEIGELSIQSQLKLLYLTQDGEYQQLGSDTVSRTEARFIFATNQDLTKKQQSGEFRKDLFFRLSTHSVRIPPLRERTEDIPVLAEYFIKTIAAEHGINAPYMPDNVRSLLSNCDFPGNTRQLRAAIYDAVMKAEEEILAVSDFRNLLTANTLYEDTPTEQKIQNVTTVEAMFNSLISKAMTSANGNQIKAAAMLGISQSTLSRRLKKLKD